MLEEIVKPLLSWYRKDHRILPWRQQKNPYYIWISEIMLQQTRVEAVKPYFERFIQALPTVEEVADCPEEYLLKLWEVKRTSGNWQLYGRGDSFHSL